MQTPFFKLQRTLKASSSNRRPLSIPLLRKLVEIPNKTPDRTRRLSCLVDVVCPSKAKLFANAKHPAKANKAQEVSAYGAERKTPAGEITWRAAVLKANLVVDLENTSIVSLNTTRTARRWAK
jgi:hypothetical protein